MKYCIYCDKTKEAKQFSKEHIIPKSIAGNLLDFPFITFNVCKICNNTLGRHVDGQFLKTWFLKQISGMGAYDYIDLKKTKSMPLLYFGRIEDLAIDGNEECELWISPCHARILHIHNKSPHEYVTYAGGDPIISRKNPGKALFINVSTNQDWIKLGLKSFLKHFNKCKRFVANVVFADKLNYEIFGNKMDCNIDKIFKSFMQCYPSDETSQKIMCNMSINLDFDQRFLSKVALGVGYNVFGNDYLNTEYCKLLRTAMWEKDNQKRKELRLLNSSYFDNRLKNACDIFEWKGGITLTLFPIDNYLFIIINIYGNAFVAGITNSIDLIRNSINLLGKLSFGVIYLVIPAINYYSGKIDLIDFIYHKKKIIINPELGNLEAMRADFIKLPKRN